MAAVNRQWLLASHPDGMPDESNWRLVEEQIGAPAPGQILARAHYLSVDPYMRGRISRRRNYAAGVEIGAVMTGGGVGEVVESRHPDFARATSSRASPSAGRSTPGSAPPARARSILAWARSTARSATSGCPG